MPEFSMGTVGLKVGLEIHQQLATDRKLFCGCRPAEHSTHDVMFYRRLRASKSEMGRYDHTVLFEKSRASTIEYHGNSKSSCLVEHDEEPPHGLDPEAKRIALIIAASLKSTVFTETYPMRKTVVDGSNTTGFQRTMLISQGGYYEAGGIRIKVQSICLEEDAARILPAKDDIRRYSLDRLGIPLVEIATEPFEAEPGQVKKIALALGRILRSTRMVRRGIGTIRQDVNVSIRDGGGAVIEVKGVQQLDQLEKILEYEAKRQYGLLRISEHLKNVDVNHNRRIDITESARSWNSRITRDGIRNGRRILLIIFEGMAGMFGTEYVPGVRLGRDVAELVRPFGLGGVFHSDELPAYGITRQDVDMVRTAHNISQNDAFLVLAVPEPMRDIIPERIIERIRDIRDHGIPRDTRLATQSGETKFQRPRPGAARMYPETDVPPVITTKKELDSAMQHVPKPWEQSVSELRQRFGLSAQLAEQVLDSKYVELFETMAASMVAGTDASPAFMASILCSSITRLERDGLDPKLLTDAGIAKAFELLDAGKIAKESVEMILRDIMAGRSGTVEEAMKNTAIHGMTESELEGIIEGIVEKNLDIIDSQKERAAGPLMGIVMKELRGRASGKTINAILLRNIRKRIG